MLTLTKPFSQMSLLDIQPSHIEQQTLTAGEHMVLRGEMTQTELDNINKAGLEAVKFFDMLFKKY